MNLTLFLGAGFSAPFNLPVMNNFFTFADGSDRLDDADRRLLNDLTQEARAANSFLESSPTNLEDILSLSVMGERLGLIEDAASRSAQLRDIIRRVYTTPGDPSRYWSRYAPLKQLLGGKLDEFSGHLSFVTTNYDLNIESACYHHRTPVSLGLQYAPATEQGDLYHGAGPTLFKLHGSANWFTVSDSEDVVVESTITHVGTPIDEPRLTLPLVCASDYEKPGDPVIIPPSFLKPDLPEALKDVWRGAAKELSQANVVAFIGYSFPESDTEMMYFLARAFTDNLNLRAIFVVDPLANIIVTRLQGTGSRLGSHFRSLLTSIPSNWTKVTLPLKDYRGPRDQARQ